MNVSQSISLENAFLEDHRKMMRLMLQLLQALQAGESRLAVETAERLDRQAGPHIEFEEAVLYPLVARAEGQAFAERLYSEHQVVLRAIKRLLIRGEDRPLDSEAQSDLIDDVQVGLDHAESCGTLVSHLASMPPDQQRQSLERLAQFQREGLRWSELPSRTNLIGSLSSPKPRER